MTRHALGCALAFLLFTPGWGNEGQQTDPVDPSTQLHPEVTGPVSEQETREPAIEPLGEDRYKIGSVLLDRPAGEIRFPGAIAIREGALEYLACAPNGKLYESLLRADVNPYNLQLALLLLGLQPKNNLTYQGDPTTPAGDPVTILVAWKTEEGSALHRVEDLLWARFKKKTMGRTDWVFSGSMFAEGVFAASVNKSLIALFNDPTAILNNPLPTGADDTAYVAHTEALPPVDTVVEIILRAEKKRKGGAP